MHPYCIGVATKTIRLIIKHFLLIMKHFLHGLVPLGSIPELPAETCKEIKASEGEKAVSGKYWFDSIEPGNVLLAYCNMSTEGEFN